jgi:Dolichyl-phosphate-mannose-protein mannosyltransferase
MTRHSTAVRLFLTVWLVYAAFATTNVARETYLAVSLGERLSVRVDPYLGLHPDLFEIPGRGAYINSNPGASMVGALPYALSRPLIAGLFALRPGLEAPKPPTSYADARPNRTKLMNEMRARGLDVRLALAALATQVGLMAPLGALAVVLLYFYLQARYRHEREAFWLALLYGLGTPVFFRSAFLNQNALLTHLTLITWVVVTWPATDTARPRRHAWAWAGFLLGLGLLMDYSAAPLALVFGLWAIVEGWQRQRVHGAVELGGACVLGALGPVCVLLGYQWLAFGSPWFPAQRYMPVTEFSVRGLNGFTWPSFDLLWRNLLDPRYGLFAFCPLLLAALAAPLVRTVPGDPTRGEQRFALLAVVALLVFSSSNQFANLQWNTGVRYLVPAVPLLFVLVVPVLRAVPRWGVLGLVAPTVVISFAVSMMREDVPTSLELLFTGGPTLPVLITLQKTAAAYAPFLAGGVQPFGALALLLLAGSIALIWWLRRPAAVT